MYVRTYFAFLIYVSMFNNGVAMLLPECSVAVSATSKVQYCNVWTASGRDWRPMQLCKIVFDYHWHGWDNTFIE